LCAKNGEFEKMIAAGGSAVAYAWFVWEKDYKGDTVVKWINYLFYRIQKEEEVLEINRIWVNNFGGGLQKQA